MGDSRGHWEGDTLVVESGNFTDKTTVGGARNSASARITERFTRVDPEMIDYEVTINDPETFTKPWTFRWTITSQPNYQIYQVQLPRREHRDARTRSAPSAPTRRRPPRPRRRASRCPSACSRR